MKFSLETPLSKLKTSPCVKHLSIWHRGSLHRDASSTHWEGKFVPQCLGRLWPEHPSPYRAQTLAKVLDLSPVHRKGTVLPGLLHLVDPQPSCTSAGKRNSQQGWGGGLLLLDLQFLSSQTQNGETADRYLFSLSQGSCQKDNTSIKWQQHPFGHRCPHLLHDKKKINVLTGILTGKNQ